MNPKNHPMRTASRILTFITICFSLLLAGCHSGTDNPATPGVNRSLQIFTPLAMWDDSGYSLDSASSMWINPLYPIQGPPPGDLAVSDFFGVIEISPLATAFVKANGCVDAPDAKINLVAFDMYGTQSADLNVDLAFDTDVQFFCRHPAVEVTYSHDFLTGEGHLGIHVVWSQWTDSGDDGHWELYYKYFHVPVTDAGTGIQWGDASDPDITAIDFPGSDDWDEIQPDLAVNAENGHLLVIFVQTDEPDNTFYNILVLLGEIQESSPATWHETVYPVPSLTESVEKGFPKIDVGLMDRVPFKPFIKENRAVAVWSEWDTYPGRENFQIWYADADPLNPGSITPMQLTFSENGIGQLGPYESWDFLPSVDIPAPSSASDNFANLQAVICYMGTDIVGDVVYDQRVYCRITPDHIFNQFLLRGDDDHYYMMDANEARVPEVACYQMNDPGSEHQWFGVAMHATECGFVTGELRLYTGSWSYQVDGAGSVILNFEQDWFKDESHTPSWSLNNPATGPTLCLRYFEPNWDIEDYCFGLGWFEGSGGTPNYVGLAQGSITS